MAIDPRSPRWPSFTAGGYESFYLKAHHLLEPFGFWIRSTVTTPPGGEPAGMVWCTVFDPREPRPIAIREAIGVPPAIGGNGKASVVLGQTTLSSHEAIGAATADGRTVSWRLRIEPLEPPLLHLSRPSMYEGGFPRTKPVSLAPRARITGALEIDGRGIAVDGWDGMVGHNWGAEHAHRWIWLHGLGFREHEDAWIDVVLGQIRLGPITTPWIGNGMLGIRGERIRLGGIGKPRATRVRAATPEAASILLRGEGLTVSLEPRAIPDRTVRWDYEGPRGGAHDVSNCSIAQLSMIVSRRGEPPTELTTDHGATYELGLPQAARDR